MKIWTEDEIRTLLETNKQMVERSLLQMYGLQTDSEQADKDTKYTNAVGFNKADGIVLARFAETLLRFKSFKSDKQVGYVRKRLLKYVRQITKIANKELVPGTIKTPEPYRKRQYGYPLSWRKRNSAMYYRPAM